MSDEGKMTPAGRVARDLMIPLDSYPHISATATLRDAVAAFSGAQIERRGTLSLPRIVLVFDDDGRLAGAVRRRDIMLGLLPGFLTRREDPHAEALFAPEDDVDLNLADLFRDDAHKVLVRNADAPVSEVMQPIANTVPPDADLLELIKKMVQVEFHMLPVIENERVIGVVRSVELLNQIRRLLAD